MPTTYTIPTNQSKTIVLTKSGNYTVTLKGEGAHAKILGAFHLTGKQELKINVITIHTAPHTSADTLIKVIADDNSKAEVNGTIIVQKKAQQTNSFLTENILMLSPNASAHAIPNLEIEADDVKCSHAATVGTIDEEHLFYLMSRGINQEIAKQLIIDGFLQEVKDRINKKDI